MKEIPILPGERLDDLQRNGLRILQKESGFRFGTDAVLLADFASIRAKEHFCDLGSGTGVLALLLTGRAEGTTCDAFELQEEMAQMADRSVRLNGLEDRITVHHADVRDAAKRIGYGVCSLAVTNPPYTKQGAGLVSPMLDRAISRSAKNCSLEEWMRAGASILQNGGRLCCVFPAFRVLELTDAMRAAGLEPKRLRFVTSRPEKEPKLLLMEAKKGGHAGLRILPLLITHEPDGGFTREMRRIYGETEG